MRKRDGNVPGHGMHPPLSLEASPCVTFGSGVVDIVGAAAGCTVIGALRDVRAAGGKAGVSEDVLEVSVGDITPLWEAPGISLDRRSAVD